MQDMIEIYEQNFDDMNMRSFFFFFSYRILLKWYEMATEQIRTSGKQAKQDN